MVGLQKKQATCEPHSKTSACNKLELAGGNQNTALYFLPHANCYSLDQECFPEAHVLRAGCQSVTLLGNSGTFRRRGSCFPSERKPGQWRLAPKGDSEVELFSCLCFPSHYEVNRHPASDASTMMFCFLPQVQSSRTKLPYTETSKTIAKINLALVV